MFHYGFVSFFQFSVPIDEAQISVPWGIYCLHLWHGAAPPLLPYRQCCVRFTCVSLRDSIRVSCHAVGILTSKRNSSRGSTVDGLPRASRPPPSNNCNSSQSTVKMHRLDVTNYPIQFFIFLKRFWFRFGCRSVPSKALRVPRR